MQRVCRPRICCTSRCSGGNAAASWTTRNVGTCCPTRSISSSFCSSSTTIPTRRFAPNTIVTVHVLRRDNIATNPFQVTGSQLYGTDRNAQRALRSLAGGRLKTELVNGEQYPPRLSFGRRVVDAVLAHTWLADRSHWVSPRRPFRPHYDSRHSSTDWPRKTRRTTAGTRACRFGPRSSVFTVTCENRDGLPVIRCPARTRCSSP